MKKKNDMREFHFQVMPLEEAKNLVLAGDGKYADLKAGLLSQIPKLESGQAFTFGTNGGTPLTEGERHSMTASLNRTLTQAGLHWRVCFAKAKKLFIVAPMKWINDQEKPSKTSELPARQEPKSPGLSIREFVAHAERCLPGTEDHYKRLAIILVGFFDFEFRSFELAKAFDVDIQVVYSGTSNYKRNKTGAQTRKHIEALRSYMKKVVPS